MAGRRLLDAAIEQYPILGNLGLQYKETPRNDRGFLEFWPVGEPGSDDYKRPEEFDINKPGLEIYKNTTTPKDVMGDASSHLLRETDPMTAYKYMGFRNSITPEQTDTLKNQYAYAQKNEGENRTFQDWLETSGLPAAFRGYAFDQWPKEFNDKFYSQDQRAGFDDLMKYYKGEGF